MILAASGTGNKAQQVFTMERENGFLKWPMSAEEAKSRVTELWSDRIGWASGRLIHSAKLGPTGTPGGLGCVGPSGGWGNTGYRDPNGHLGWCCTVLLRAHVTLGYTRHSLF